MTDQDGPKAGAEVSPGFIAALTEELSKKTPVCWLRYDGVTHAVWHIWLEDAVYIVSGGNEQPLPGIEDIGRVEVLMRSKENGSRLLTWVGDASVVLPSDERWPAVTAALVTGRLNLEDLSTAADAWAARSVVSRIAPTGRVLEQPGELSDNAHLATPKQTAATTRGALPRVLHRRQKHRPKLS